MAINNLGQTSVSESYILPKCKNKPGYECTFCMEWKKGVVLMNLITKYETRFAEREKKINSLENSCNKMKGIKAGN